MLQYDIELSQLLAIGDQLGASEKQVKLALSRAMRRTEGTLRRMSSKGLIKTLQLRSAAVMRRRLKSIKMRMSSNGGEFGLWYGLNPLPVSSFKGRPRETSSGASFRGTEYDGGFVARSKVKGKQTIFKRAKGSRLPVAEQLHPIEDQAIVFIEDDVFDQLETIFWGHFQRDLMARVKFSIGAS